MLFAILILIGAGLSVCIKNKVQASSSLVIQGRPAQHIGIALILGGVGAIALPLFFNVIGLCAGFVGDLVTSIATAFAFLVYVAVIVIREKRKQSNENNRLASLDKNKI